MKNDRTRQTVAAVPATGSAGQMETGARVVENQGGEETTPSRSGDHLTRILVMEDAALNVHQLRAESRRSGLCFLYECARNLSEVKRLLGRRPAVVLATLGSLPGVGMKELAQLTSEAGGVLLLVGGDTEEERATLTRLRDFYAATCRRTRLPWLPLLLSRVVHETAGRRRGEEALAQAAEQVREIHRLSIIGQLTGSIAHEINNPLEAVTNLMYLMSSDEALPAHMRAYVDLAEQELGRVGHIVKQTLSFNRESHRPEPTRLSSLIEEVARLYARRMSEKQVLLQRRFEQEESVLVFPGEMRQVYSNLLANAIEATEPGGRIVVRVHRARRHLTHREPVDGVRVVFSDSGCGITPASMLRLCQPFYTTKGQGGTGLGLWVSQSIVRRYDGVMQVRSSTDAGRHGTTFGIFIPVNSDSRVLQFVQPGSSESSSDQADDALSGDCSCGPAATSVGSV